MRSLFRSPARTLESLFAMTGLFLLTDAVLSLQRTDAFGFNIDQFEGDFRTQLLFMGLYAVTFAILIARRREVAVMMRRGGWAWALVIFAVASAGWSAAPAVTMRRGFALFGATAFGVFLGTRFNRRELILLIAAAMGIVVTASYIMVKTGAGVVSFGGHKGLWRGAFGQKNIFARMLVMAIFSFGFVARTERRLRWLAIPAIVVCLAMLLRTGSATGLLMPFALAAVVPPIVLLRRRAAAALPALSIILAIGALGMIWGFQNFSSITGTVGRDPSLTGRTELWDAMLEEIDNSPWVGHGYAGFWLGKGGPSDHVWGKINWQPLHGHNGYLDVVADLGVIGLFFVVALLARSFGRARALLRRDRDPSALLPAMFVCFLVLYNVTESVILKPNSLFWPLFVAICIVLPRADESVERRHRAPPEQEGPFFITARPPVLLEPMGASR